MRYQEDNRAASSAGDLLPESLCCQRGVQLGQMAAWCFGMLWPYSARCQQVDCVGRLLMNHNLLEQGPGPVDWPEYLGLAYAGHFFLRTDGDENFPASGEEFRSAM